MASADYYREEANRCRKLAAASPDSDAAKRWRQLATEYDDLAEALEASDRLIVQRDPMQQQPMQQQPMQQPQPVRTVGQPGPQPNQQWSTPAYQGAQGDDIPF